MSTGFTIPNRLLLGPGPSNTPASVLAAMSQPTIGHLDPVFIEMMDQIKQMLQATFQTQNRLTMPVSAPGSAGMETCLVNLLEPGDQAIVAINGVFGKRMVENVVRAGGVPIVVEFEWGSPVDPQRIEEVLNEHPNARLLAFVHAETSTGARSDAETLCRLAHERDVLSVVDMVTSWCGIEVDVDGWKADAVYSGAQKCLSAVPGIAPVTFSEKAADRIRTRSKPVQSWFLDMSLVMAYWAEGGQRAYHHTAPVNTLYAIHEALRLVLDEGLENRWARHRTAHEALVRGVESLGLSFLVDEPYRLPMLNAIKVPEGVDEAAVRTKLLTDYNMEIGAGLGPLQGKIWRIGLMGNNATVECANRAVSALDECLRALK
ncbi:aminotransferase class V-fold PLP-dependent enzyme [Hahella sp. KA22]|uniref:pyridoxal-phosphate-dependent aminotransferase family protein n=1 Tax=Hahella sp. KA22 TaxID=1628392 RepID=UPI000FDD8370|nr:alanine--glyoxylate aminotransferase family protein [Hahella sp. KA22]AZZ90834.1 alanine--glyoxylate aminotransferase family protein [Hahella sp. KA22]QAY54204.1 aminotransferase class V-fold PLP-dependent enzyme [Hahella sp. KA22]